MRRRYTGLVIAFTVPIIVVGYEAGDREEARALARMVQTLLGCTITAAVSLVWQTNDEVAEPLLRKKLASSIDGLLKILHDLQAMRPPHQSYATGAPDAAAPADVKRRHWQSVAAAFITQGEHRHSQHTLLKAVIWSERARKVRTEFSGSFKALISEAAGETSMYARPTFPQHDFEAVVHGLAHAWDAAMRMMKGVSDMVAAIVDAHEEHSAAVLERFFEQAAELIAPLTTTMHSLKHALQTGTLDATTGELLPNLLALQAATYNFWHNLDRDWAQLLIEYLVSMASKATQRADGLPPLFTWLATTQSLAQLDYVTRHMANAAERMLSIVMLQNPPKVAEDDEIETKDLYETEVDV